MKNNIHCIKCGREIKKMVILMGDYPYCEICDKLIVYDFIPHLPPYPTLQKTRHFIGDLIIHSNNHAEIKPC